KSPVVFVTQTFTATSRENANGAQSGFQRRAEIRSQPGRIDYDFRLAPLGIMKTVPQLRRRGLNYHFPEPAQAKQFDINLPRILAAIPGGAVLDVAYLTALPVDRFADSALAASPPLEKLDAVPGYD